MTLDVSRIPDSQLQNSKNISLADSSADENLDLDSSHISAVESPIKTTSHSIQDNDLSLLECGQRFEISLSPNQSRDFFDATLLPQSTPKRPLIPRSAPVKRKNIDTHNSYKKPKPDPIMNLSNITTLEYYNKLSIKNFIETYDSDVLVMEYVDKLLAFPTTPPIIPQESEHDLYLNFKPGCQFPDKCTIELVTNFISYFQLNYFRHNVGSAIGSKTTLFNPKCNFHIPQFPLVPKKTLSKMHECKEQFVIFTQDHALQGSEFTRELLLIRNIHILGSFLNSQVANERDLHNHILHFFMISYLKARTEFSKVFNIKVIDWGNKEGKARLTEPAWRKVSPEEPPIKAHNKYASSLVQRIVSGQESFQVNDVRNAYLESQKQSSEVIQKRKSEFGIHDRDRPSDPQSSEPGTSSRGFVGNRAYARGRRSVQSNRNAPTRGYSHGRTFNRGRGAFQRISNSNRGAYQGTRTRGQTGFHSQASNSSNLNIYN
jgi:hypothetical protein